MHSNKMDCIDYINDNGFEVKPDDDYSIGYGLKSVVRFNSKLSNQLEII
jgi:hypothetical protein